jgi:predicted ester cyclase
MKFFFIPLLLLGSPAITHLKEINMNTQQKEAVRRLYEECLNKRNFVSLKDIFGDDYTGAGGEKGPAAFEHNIRPLIAAFPDIQWKVEDILQEGDEVAVRHTWKGTNTGVYRGIAPTNKPFTNTGLAIFQFKDGKIVTAWIETDRLGFNQQLGVVPVTIFPAQPK